MPAITDAQRAAIDFALGVGRRASSDLRRCKAELGDASEANAAQMFWPLALLTWLPRLLRQRRLERLSAQIQHDLQDLDAAVDVLRAHGIELPARAAARCRRVVPAGAWEEHLFGEHQPFDRPLHVVQSAMRRVDAVQSELRRRREGDAGERDGDQ